MRARKASDSPSGYDREVRPRRFIDAMARQEREVRRTTDERWQRKVQAVAPVSRTVEDEDFPGCVF